MSAGHRLPLSAEQMMALARETVRIDIHDSEAVEPFAVLHRSYCTDAKLAADRVIPIQNYLLRLLCNRLRMLRDYAAHPEIADEVIRGPVVICGLPRTGSTKMQKLLAASGDFNYLTFWKSLNPSLLTGVRDEAPDARIRDTDAYVEWLNRTAPGARLMHDYMTHEPEEETYLLMHCLRSPMLGMTELSGYTAWLAEQNAARFQVDFLVKALKYLQWQGHADPAKPWLLKTPIYFGNEAEIKRVFPDAVFVATHRHPEELVPSLCSFMTETYKLVSDARTDPVAFATATAYQVQQHIQNRSTRSDLQPLDVHYKELTDAAGDVAARVYAFARMTLTGAAQRRMAAWNENNPQHARGAHRYSATDYKLTKDDIGRIFAPYISLLAALFPGRI